MARLDLSTTVDPQTPEERLLEATLPLSQAHRDGDACHVERLLHRADALNGGQGSSEPDERGRGFLACHPLGRDVLRIRLVDERYYHGDTCLCSFGPKREFLLAYPPVIEPASLATLREARGDQLIEISDEDAAIYAANSFAFTREGTPFLVMPQDISTSLERKVRERGVEIISADVSEFHKKGGGSVKCMIGDLGEIV